MATASAADAPPTGPPMAITPPATLAVLRVGYPVQIDPSILTERIEGDRRWQ